MRKPLNLQENIKWEYDVLYCSYFEYTTNTEDAIKRLKRMINAKCLEGWIPEGAMSFVEEEKTGCKYLCQNIIRQISTSNSETRNSSLSKELLTRPVDYAGEGEL